MNRNFIKTNKAKPSAEELFSDIVARVKVISANTIKGPISDEEAIEGARRLIEFVKIMLKCASRESQKENSKESGR